ncbi:zinc finger protein Xfin-like [Sphaeramia orbicularis]|uniref:Zinc finger protein Xfin-like n=1 Tax=Sphaeramia orbicularis TaxID=375764 RepID=A0A672YRW3_9TELE|nr:zinc finger protein Xfin-like [Sphaeramia orbicularis]
MSIKVEILRSLVEQRLTAAAEEIFGLFERTIAEYEEELCRTKEENQRQKQILDEVWNQKNLIHPAECPPADVQQPSAVKEDVPLEQEEEWNLKEPEVLQLKQEQEELWTHQETDITTFHSSPFYEKNEDDEGKVQETDRENCGGFSECGVTYSEFNMRQVDDTPRDQMTYNDVTICEVGVKKKQHPCSECGKTFNCRSRLNLHLKIHTGEKPHGCSVCQKRFSDKSTLRKHMVTHTGEKAFRCLICHKCFRLKHHLQAHMKTHMRARMRGETGVVNSHMETNLNDETLMNNLKTVLLKMNLSPSNIE